MQRISLFSPGNWASAVAVAAAVVLLPGCSEKPAAGADVAGVPYPLDTCVVSGEKLGSMGEPVVKSYDGHQVKFCCSSCIKDFEKDKAKFLSKIDGTKK